VVVYSDVTDSSRDVLHVVVSFVFTLLCCSLLNMKQFRAAASLKKAEGHKDG